MWIKAVIYSQMLNMVQCAVRLYPVPYKHEKKNQVKQLNMNFGPKANTRMVRNMTEHHISKPMEVLSKCLQLIMSQMACDFCSEKKNSHKRTKPNNN